jgi:thioesterase domain-containing protein
VHALSGDVTPYRGLASRLGDDQPVYGLQALGLDGGREPLRKIEDMAAAYVEVIRTVQPKGPYHLGGYAIGGWVAYEMARRLVQAGEQVALLAELATGVPLSISNPAAFTYADMVVQYFEDFNRLVTSSLRAEQTQGAPPGWNPEALWPPPQRVFVANVLGMWRYKPEPFTGGIDVFLTADQQVLSAADPSLGWKALCTGTAASHAVEGSVFDVLDEPRVEKLAQAVRACLLRGTATDRAPSR